MVEKTSQEIDRILKEKGLSSKTKNERIIKALRPLSLNNILQLSYIRLDQIRITEEERLDEIREWSHYLLTIEQRIKEFCELIDVGINGIAYTIPSNPHNIQSVLEKLRDLDPSSLDTTGLVLAHARFAVDHNDPIEPYIYNAEGLEKAHEEGFEAGYQRALEVTAEADRGIQRSGKVDLD